MIFRRRHLDPFFFNADNCFEDSLEVISFIGGECAGHVFPDAVSWISAICCIPHFLNDPDRLKEQAGSRTVMDSGTLAGDRQILTRTAEGDDIHRRQIAAVQPGYITVMLHTRHPPVRHKYRKRLYFRIPDRNDPGEYTAQGERTGAVKQAAECQLLITHRPPPLHSGRAQ